MLVVPPALLAGFGEHPVSAVVEELRGLGYDEVVSVHRYEDALRREVIDLAATGDAPAPLISPVCPAVMNLVEVKFPSLVEHLAPLASPWEAAQLDLDGRGATFAVSCPSQRTALLAQRPTAQRDTVTVESVRDAVLPRLAARVTRAPGAAASPPQAGGADDLLVVTGVSHVLAVLEAVEDGRLPGVSAIEPYLCDGGCFGSPLLREDAHVAAWRWAAVGGDAPGDGGSHERTPALPRPARHPSGRRHGRRHPQADPAGRRDPGPARQRLRRVRRAHVRRARRRHRHGARLARALPVRRPGGGERDMKLEDIAQELGFTELTPEVSGNRDTEIDRGYASDLLSDVLAHAPEGGLLVTLQVHLNVIAVASHAELAAVVFAGNRRPEDDVLAKAAAEGLALYSSPADTFDIVGRLYALGVKGNHA